MTTILNGLLGGVLVGLVAGIVTQAVDGEPSATAVVLQRAVGPRVSTSRLLRLATHLLYGCLAGGLLLVLELYAFGLIGVPPTAIEAFGVALAWSLFLCAMLGTLWRVGSPRSFDRSRLHELLVYHLVYGIGFGIWIRVSWIT